MSIERREREHRWTLTTALVLLCALVAEPGHAAEDGVDFKTQVWPILQSRCVSCHGPDEQKGAFRVDSRASLLQGGESEEVAVVAGRPEKSPLLTRVASHDDSLRMPPKGEPLTVEQVAVLARWVRADAIWPDDFDARQAIEHRPLTWAWRPVRKPAVPPGEIANPIDAFVNEQLTARGLQMSPAADPRTFIRRLTFDLTGLPPTPEEVAEFVAACDATYTKTSQLPDAAVEKLTERLLASPHYGEHWARHWLDVVRFSESDGFEEDQLRAHAWTYRDYVVQAFNQDKPYFQFVREQIAGDVLAPVSPESIAATGMLVAGSWDAVQRVTPSKLGRLQSREEQLEEIVSTVSQAFLGLTVNCARCHLHKYDPIPQADYYRIKAVFEGVDHGVQPRQHGTRRMLNAADDAAWLAKVTPLQQRIAEIDKAFQLVDKQLRDAKDVATLVAELQAQQTQLREERQQIQRDLQTKYPVTLAFVGDRFQPAPTVLFSRGDVKQPGEAVTPGGLSAIAQPTADFGLEANSSEAERRIKFAHWLTAPEHPFTARVMVNRVWQYHFGCGLVETSGDLGANGALPSHPALLDWLASEFIASNGSVKSLHRLIVTSAAYRQAAVAASDDDALRGFHAKAAAIDADNRLLWRYPARRLEGEVVRDAMLAMSGALNRELGGPSFRPFTVTQLNTYFYHLFDKDELAYNRRSLYRIHAITGRSPLLDALDCPSPAVTIPRRRSTVTPLQALALMNDTFVLRQADKLARKISAEHAQVEAQVTQAFEIVLARPPRTNELAASRDVVQQHGLATLTWSLFNTSEFMYAR